MYVSIDMDRQQVLHKHPDHETVSAISWLECGQHTSIRIDGVESDNFLRGVAHGDLCHLYTNVTGDNHVEMAWGDRAHQFRERLREAVRNMPVTDAVTDEVLAQVAAVDDRLRAGERFSYAKGAMIPAQPQELFPLVAAPLAPSQTGAADERAKALAKAQQEFQAAERRGDFLPGASHDPDEQIVVTSTQQEEPKPAKARAGSVQPVVFAAAKEAWEKRAPGTTWDTVRAELAAKLIDDGYHPTTVRIKLSKWAKENGI